jgi:O-antigen/teichoic acid export membrane protein
MSFSKIKVLAKDSILYGITGIISRAITIFMVPVYTRIFAPADFGIINLVNITFFLIGLFAVCALDNAAARWFYDTKDSEDQKTTIATWFWFQLGASIFLAVLLYASSPLFAKYLLKVPYHQIHYPWLMACCNLITNILPTLILNWYRLDRKPVATLFFSLSQSLFTIGLTILFVVYLKWHISGVYAALFLSSFLFSLIALVQIYPWLYLKYLNKQRLREMLRFSLPMMPAALAFWLLNSTDAYFILYFKNKTEVGLFSIGASLASGVTLFTGAFQQAWGPFAFSILNEPDAKKTYANVFLAFGSISSIIILAMFLMSPELLVLFTTPDYYSAAWVAPILSINVVLIGFTYIASVGASIAKNTTFYATGVLIAAVLTVLLDLLLIPAWGKEGSALATVIAQVFVPAYLFYKSNKLYPINYNYLRVVFYILGAISIGIIIRQIDMKDIILAIGFKVSIIFLYTGLLIYFSKEIFNPLFRRSL